MRTGVLSTPHALAPEILTAHLHKLLISVIWADHRHLLHVIEYHLIDLVLHAQIHLVLAHVDARADV